MKCSGENKIFLKVGNLSGCQVWSLGHAEQLLFSCLCSKVSGCQVTGYSLSLIKEIFKHCWHNWLNFRWLRQPFQFRKLRRFWGIKLRQHIYGKFQLNHWSWQNRNVYDNFSNTIWTNWWSWKKYILSDSKIKVKVI